MRGQRQYELSNHLGNVLAVVSDQWKTNCIPVTVGEEVVFVYENYQATVVQATDYSAFGAPLPGRTYVLSASFKSRFGFNGEEGESDLYGEGMTYDLGARFYDGRLGKMFSHDPLEKKYPFQSTYAYCYNNPIWIVDVKGMGDNERPKLKDGEIPSTAKIEYFSKGAVNPVSKKPLTGVKSFTIDGHTYTANYNTKTGSFVGYKNMSTSKWYSSARYDEKRKTYVPIVTDERQNLKHSVVDVTPGYIHHWYDEDAFTGSGGGSLHYQSTNQDKKVAGATINLIIGFASFGTSLVAEGAAGIGAWSLFTASTASNIDDMSTNRDGSTMITRNTTIQPQTLDKMKFGVDTFSLRSSLINIKPTAGKSFGQDFLLPVKALSIGMDASAVKKDF